ncbi:hypothetical protein PFICI_10698 [Pestalotiopsis fici W106-1]|uniref:Azaphilone pigments biosynthesis cluster protein L N-terminal domain-containing protein n=1 Tax=Pestalotiopsis fici (strain W106-1 / CGMCC3.15140) TaxID=1229662 RepID=W3X0H2_PESFW|nr:uncharacterized protein PFICI_10698 [Pestalotiopsis fici W106-1]ETS78636.1 hypothetical protein PFICI_10698 [Pestalotiopsis fici W106-1]
MDPLSVTASVIAVATLAAQSVQAAYQVIDGLAQVPQAIANSKIILLETQSTLDALNGTLNENLDKQAQFEPLLQMLALDRALGSTQDLCTKFGSTIAKYTRHSTELRFSNRDRILLNLHESHITNFNQQLNDCRNTLSLMIGTITLIISASTSVDVREISVRFEAQEQALSTLITHLLSVPATSATSEPPAPDSEMVPRTQDEGQTRIQRTAILRDTCEVALQATRAKRSGQTFGDMHLDQSMAMQGIVGQAQEGVDQSFGKLTAQNKSRAFQGQMNATSFAQMFNAKE